VTALPAETYVAPALRLALELGHPIYDCLYLATAIRHGTYVVTADRRFAAIAQRPGHAERIRLLST